MSETPPVEKLAYAVLLGTLSTGAEAFRIRPDGDDHVVEHLVAGETREEMRGPTAVLAAAIRRMSVMANLPTYKKDEAASGFIHLQIGEGRQAYFAVRVSGHGAALVLDGRSLTEAQYLAR